MPDTGERERALIATLTDHKIAHVTFEIRRGSTGVKSCRTTEPTQKSVWDLMPAITDVYEAGDGVLIVEAWRTEDGGYEITQTRELAGLDPARLILDPGFRLPEEPRHAAPEPEIGPPTDPVVLAEVRELVAEFIARYTEIVGTPPPLGEGCSEEDLLAAERAIGLRLPDDLRALYRVVEWDPHETGLLGRQKLLPLAGLAEDMAYHPDGLPVLDDDAFAVFPVVLEPEPRGHVRRARRSRRWLNIAGDMACNDCALDLDPGPLGRRGQLIEHGRDFHDHVGYVAPSVIDLLRQVVAALRAGDHQVSGGYLIPGDGIGSSAVSRATEIRRVDGGDPAEALAAGEAPEATQSLILHGVDRLDLALLAARPNLRSVTVTGNDVRGTLPHGLPVEALSVRADTVDLTGLHGHPALWSLEVTGAVDITPLAGLGIVRLDLSGAEAAGLEILAGLPTLRVLTLNAAQWWSLRDEDALPTGLAAASMPGNYRLADVLGWAEFLRR